MQTEVCDLVILNACESHKQSLIQETLVQTSLSQPLHLIINPKEEHDVSTNNHFYTRLESNFLL